MSGHFYGAIYLVNVKLCIWSTCSVKWNVASVKFYCDFVIFCKNLPLYHPVQPRIFCFSVQQVTNSIIMMWNKCIETCSQQMVKWCAPRNQWKKKYFTRVDIWENVMNIYDTKKTHCKKTVLYLFCFTSNIHTTVKWLRQSYKIFMEWTVKMYTPS